jgi:hypothetical protein
MIICIINIFISSSSLNKFSYTFYNIKVNYLVLAGGGNGGASTTTSGITYYGGGGGGGGLALNSITPNNSQTWNISVGNAAQNSSITKSTGGTIANATYGSDGNPGDYNGSGAGGKGGDCGDGIHTGGIPNGYKNGGGGGGESDNGDDASSSSGGNGGKGVNVSIPGYSPTQIGVGGPGGPQSSAVGKANSGGGGSAGYSGNSGVVILYFNL